MLQDALTHIGYALELLGLAVAAFGMWRSWKVNAQGAAFWPAWMRTAYFKLARLWGQTPQPIEKFASDSVHVTDSADVVLTVGRVAGATVDERLDSLEADVDKLKVTSQELANQQQNHMRTLERAVQVMRREISDAQQTTERRLSAQTVADLRPAAFGVALAAFGLLLQWIGSG